MTTGSLITVSITREQLENWKGDIDKAWGFGLESLKNGTGLVSAIDFAEDTKLKILDSLPEELSRALCHADATIESLKLAERFG